MKQFLLVCFIPFVVVIVASLYIFTYFNLTSVTSRGVKQSQLNFDSIHYISKFDNEARLEEIFLSTGKESDKIFLLGSSELSANTPVLPYNFVSDKFKTKVVGVGHAGNQCFSILCQLLANEKKLSNAPVVIIISPGWFEGKAAAGTTSEVLLEFVSEKFMEKIAKSHSDSTKMHVQKRIAKLFTEFNSPSVEIKRLAYQHHAGKSYLSALFFTPLKHYNELIGVAKKTELFDFEKAKHSFSRATITADSVIINWDSLFSDARTNVLNASSNNELGIENSYYSEYIGDKRGHISCVSNKYNTEMSDFKALLNLIKTSKVNASFIISPLNAYYYENLNELQPVVNEIEQEMKKNKFNYLNLFESDKSKYDKAILTDVMHMSDYGWLKVNKFIIETYRLNGQN